MSGPGCMGDGPALPSMWSTVCPGEYRPHGDRRCLIQNSVTPHEHAGMLSVGVVLIISWRVSQ
jgi:hypothetical protein